MVRLTPRDFRCTNQKKKLKTAVINDAVMSHDDLLLPAYFAERESDSFFMLCFLTKIQHTKFK